MKVGLLYEKVQTDDRRLRWSLGVLFVGSAALGLYFLISPLGGELYYKVGYNRTAHQFSREIVPLFIPWGLALAAWRRGLRVPVKLLFGGALLLHLIVLFAPPAMSQDFYSYLFYGRIQAAHGANPYIHLPSEFWLDRWFAWTRWHDQTSVYGPLWMMITAGVAKTAGDSLTLAFIQLKVMILALDVAVMALIVYGAKLTAPALQRDGDGLVRSYGGSDWESAAGFGLLAFAWNPLVLVSIPLSGAVDVVLAATFVGAVVARRARRPGIATLLLALAALVKVYAVAALGLHLLLLARERNWRTALRHGAASVGIAAVAYAPYWAGWQTFNGLIQAVGYTNHSLLGALHNLFVPVLRLIGLDDPEFAAAFVLRALVVLPILAGVAIWAMRRVKDERSLWTSLLVVLTAYLLLTPWFMYWYIIGALALVAVLPKNRLTDPILTFSGTSMIATWWFPFIEEVPATLQRAFQAALRYIPPMWVFRRQQKRDALPAARPSPRREHHQPVGAGEARGTGR